MQNLLDWLSQPWEWYVAGFLISLMIPALYLFENKRFGISTSFRHLCAAVLPSKNPFFQYDWKGEGAWQLAMCLGMVLGGWLAATFLPNPHDVAISEATKADLMKLGISNFSGLAPQSVFSWEGLLSLKGFVLIVVGGFLVGFGTRWADGCTSGHAISGLANFELPSLLAVVGFFAGGLFATYFLLPLIF